MHKYYFSHTCLSVNVDEIWISTQLFQYFYKVELNNDFKNYALSRVDLDKEIYKTGRRMGISFNY